MRYKLLLFLFLTFNLYAKDILLLHSYHKGYSWSDAISKAVEEGFKDTQYQITTEYMDTKIIYTENYIEKLKEFYKVRYQNRKFELIIASDNNALEFLEKYSDEIFQNTPIVFCGINNFDKNWFDSSNIKKRTTGVIEAVDIEKNIQLIQKLHPNLSKLLVINDTTTTGKSIKKEFDKVYEKYKDQIKVEYTDKFEIANLQHRLKQLDQNSVILFMLLFRDETGQTFTFKDGLKAVEKSTQVPIYGLWDFYLEHGLVGGFLTHGYAQGEAAVKLAKKILEGKDANNIPIIQTSPNKYIFDNTKLQEFHIDKTKLPRNSIILNQPFDFYTEYKNEISIIIIVFVIFVMVIFFLVLALLQKRKAKNEFQLQFHFLQTLLNTLSNPIFYKDKEGKYLGCNEAFCTMIGKPKEQILGKTMYDFFESQKEFLKAHEEIEKKLFAKEDVDEYIMDYIMPNGKVSTMIINKTLYHDLEGNIAGILTILHDITELSNIEKEKKQHESFLAQQSKLAEIGEMISAIAHQWNEPLVEMSAIVQDLELQYKTAKLSNDDIELFVKDSMVQIQYMSKTLKDFRDFLKPSVKKSQFDIKDAFDEVLNILERQIKYSYIDLNIQYKTDNFQVYGYKNEFMQVLITLINNAKDAIAKVKKENKSHKGKIEIVVDSTQEQVSLQISDNGCGIRKKDKEKVFEPYFSTKSKGNGLGLYMSKILIDDKMDGKIYFEETTNNQTTIFIQLPKNTRNIQ
jgi:PAS domain S-box-containing protein